MEASADAEEAALAPGASDPPGYRCSLSGDWLFSALHPHELLEDELVFCVRGSMDEGIAELACDGAPLPKDGELPLSVVDVVRWAGLRPTKLDRAGFVKLWQRHVGALLQQYDDEPDVADALLLRTHTFARGLLLRFEELDFLLGASENSKGPLGILHYREDEITPYIYFLAAGCRPVGGLPPPPRLAPDQGVAPPPT